ncbi:hypothetical protein D3C76_1476720 [compost metagenome]
MPGNDGRPLFVRHGLEPTLTWRLAICRSSVVILANSKREVPDELIKRHRMMLRWIIVPVLPSPRSRTAGQHLYCADVQSAQNSLADTAVLFLATVPKLDPFQCARS